MSGISWRDGISSLEALLVTHGETLPSIKVREIVEAVIQYEDETDESIRSALWEEAVANGEEWATGEYKE